MLMIVSYDVKTVNSAGRRRLRRIAKLCLDYGQRVQYSVFECNVNPAQWAVLRERLMGEMSKEDDSLRFYFLGSNWKRRIEHVGIKKVPNLEEDALIV